MDVKELYHRYLITSMVAGFEPVVVERASGCRMTAADGREYLDCFSGLAVCNAGHGHPRVLAAAKEQMARLVHCCTYVYYNPRAAELAMKLAQVTPGRLQKSFFGNSGAEALEGGMRLAKQFTGRKELVCLTLGFHGRTVGTLSVTGNRTRKKGSGPYLPGVAFSPAPYCYRCPFGHQYPNCKLECAENVRDVLLYENPDTVAAMIVETITGSNGIIIPPPEYFPKLVEILKTYGVLLICDEVLVGWGRTGKWFACEHWNLEPDILLTGKGSASGYMPLALTTISKEISDYFDQEIIYIGSTFSGHPLAAAAGIGTIKAYKDGDLVGNSERLGEILKNKLLEMKENHPCIGDVRGLGLCAALELVKDKKTKEPIIPWFSKEFINTEGIMTTLKNEMLERGLFPTVRRNIIAIEPPLCITEAELTEGLNIINEVLNVADAFIR